MSQDHENSEDMPAASDHTVKQASASDDKVVHNGVGVAVEPASESNPAQDATLGASTTAEAASRDGDLATANVVTPSDNAIASSPAPAEALPLSQSSIHDRITQVADTPSEPTEVPKGIAVRYAGCTAVGLVREHNEDNFVMANLASAEPSPRNRLCKEAVGESGMLFAVCDGMGGAAAGEVASQMAVDSLLENLRRGGPPQERDDLARRLVSSVEEAGHRIYTVAQNERAKRGMGTTATVAVLLDKVLFLAEVGDSRAYLLRKGVLKQVTKDQSLVNQLIEAGHLTEEEAEAFEHSNIILQALGTSETVQVDLTFVELRRGDRLMLCSDGLSGLVHSDSIRDALNHFRDPVECSERLVEYAEAGGGHDNITVIVVDFDGGDLPPPGAADTFGYMQYPLVPASAATGRPPKARHSEDSEPTQPISTVPSPPASQGGSWSWIAAGVSALLVGGVVLALSSQSEETPLAEGPPPAAEAATAASEPSVEPAPAPELAKKVAVRVYTDVSQATLLVNGESHGVLLTDGELSLELEPGAYRFEAETDGNIAAVSVVTVRPDVPLDVHLNLPSEEPAPEAAPAPEAPQPLDTQGSKAPTLRRKKSALRPIAAEPAPSSEPQVVPAPTAPAPTPPPSAPPSHVVPAPVAPVAPAPAVPAPVAPAPVRDLPANPF